MTKIHRFIHKIYLLEIWNHTYNKLGGKKSPYSEAKKHFSTNCFCSISTTVDSLPPKQRPMRGLEKSNSILLCFSKNYVPERIVHCFFISFLRKSFTLWYSFLMIVHYYQTKTPISFWYRRGLNLRFLI